MLELSCRRADTNNQNIHCHYSCHSCIMILPTALIFLLPSYIPESKRILQYTNPSEQKNLSNQEHSSFSRHILQQTEMLQEFAETNFSALPSVEDKYQFEYRQKELDGFGIQFKLHQFHYDFTISFCSLFISQFSIQSYGGFSNTFQKHSQDFTGLVFSPFS